MTEYNRSYLVDELGLSAEDVDKAEQHFGPGIANDRAIDWIFSGFPGYNPKATTGGIDSSNALVATQPQTTGREPDPPTSGSDYRQEQHPAWASNALNALGQEYKPGEVAKKQWENYVYEPRREEDTVDTDQEERDRGRAGRPSPVEQMQQGGARNNPVDLTGSQEAGALPLLGEEDDELQKALALSMQDQRGFHSATVAASALGANEDDDMAQAMNLSIAELERQGSVMLESETDDPKDRIRPHPDVPVILPAPSAFLSYIPALLQALYCNTTFRSTVLSIDFPYLRDPTYENYATDAPNVFTRSLFPPSDKEEGIIKMATLQRLFVFLQKTKRAKGSLADFMDAFRIKSTPGGIAHNKSPLDDLKGE